MSIFPTSRPQYQRGQGLVEFALIGSMLFLLLFFIAFSFIWISTWNDWHYAALTGARAGTATGASEGIVATTAESALTKIFHTNSGNITVYDYNNDSSVTSLSACPKLPTTPGNEIFICVPEFQAPCGGSGSTCSGSDNADQVENGSVSVKIYGWVPAPVPLPAWGSYLPVLATDTETIQNQECDESVSACV